MDNLSDIIPASFEFKLGDAVLKFNPLTIGDLAALGNHVKQERIKQFRAACEGMEPALVVAGIESIIKSDAETEMHSPVAIQFLLHRSLQRNNKEMTFDKVGELLAVANLSEVMAIINTIGGAGKNPQGAQETAKE